MVFVGISQLLTYMHDGTQSGRCQEDLLWLHCETKRMIVKERFLADMRKIAVCPIDLSYQCFT